MPIAHQYVDPFDEDQRRRWSDTNGAGTRILFRVIERGKQCRSGAVECLDIGPKRCRVECVQSAAATQILGAKPAPRQMIAIHRYDDRIRPPLLQFAAESRLAASGNAGNADEIRLRPVPQCGEDDVRIRRHMFDEGLTCIRRRRFHRAVG